MIFKRLFSLFGIGLLILALYFIISIIKEVWPSLIAGPDFFSFKYFFLATSVLIIYWTWQVALWRSILSNLGSDLSFLNSCFLFFSNGLLAYIPGKVGNLVGMAAIAENLGISKMNTVTVVLIFQIYALISGTAVIFLLTFFLDPNVFNILPKNMFNLIGLFSCIGLLMISPYGINFTQLILKKILNKELPSSSLRFKSSLIFLMYYALGWLIQGLVIWLLFKSFLPEENIVSFFLVSISFISSYLGGLIAVIVPAGLGILEAGLILMLDSFLPEKVILYSILTFRALAIGSIAILFSITWFVRFIYKD